MQLDRKLRILLKGLDELCCLIGNEQSCHILDTDGICTELFDLTCCLLPVLKCISITKCIGKSYLSMSSAFLSFNLVGCINCSLKVS